MSLFSQLPFLEIGVVDSALVLSCELRKDEKSSLVKYSDNLSVCVLTMKTPNLTLNTE